MFSLKGDVVLDPYLGTGTTMAAAVIAERNSIGLEIDKKFANVIVNKIKDVPQNYNGAAKKRLEKHLKFVQERQEEKGVSVFKYTNKNYKLPVMTRQETEIFFREPTKVNQKKEANTFEVEYKEFRIK